MMLDITAPAEGTTLSGEVVIQGTATHPNFASYGVLYATGTRVTNDTTWRLDDPIAWDVKNMVANGNLATWDTTQVPNGQYVLALAVYEVGNDTPHVHFVNNLTVQNEEATPTPAPTPEPIATEAAPAEGGEGVPVAPTVQQPPTATPRPTPTVVPEATPEEETEQRRPSDIISMSTVREAFSTGVQLAVMLYIIGGLYIAIKAVIRYYIRQQKRKQRS
jgi:hypothetical protein